VISLKEGYNNTDYNRIQKNGIRALVAEFFQSLMDKNDYKPLITLETAQWLFVKKFPKYQRFMCYQIDKEELRQQLINKPKNVALLDENINNIKFPVKYIYLDYCNSWYSNEQFIESLFKNKLFLDNTVFAATFAQRIGALKLAKPMPIVNRIKYSIHKWAKQNQYEIKNYKPWKYKDKGHCAMVTILFSLKKVKLNDS